MPVMRWLLSWVLSLFVPCEFRKNHGWLCVQCPKCDIHMTRKRFCEKCAFGERALKGCPFYRGKTTNIEVQETEETETLGGSDESVDPTRDRSD